MYCVDFTEMATKPVAFAAAVVVVVVVVVVSNPQLGAKMGK